MSPRNQFIVAELKNLPTVLDAVGKLTDINNVIVDAVNKAADESYDLARKRMLATINLTDAYLRRKMAVTHATTQRPKAEITAFGDRKTLLSEYDSHMEIRNVRWTNGFIIANIGRFSKWPGWTQRTGQAALGIPADKKSFGVSVSVKRGQRVRVTSAFQIPGKKDGSGNNIMFSRGQGKKGGVIKALHGPAAYQMFATQIPNIEEDVGMNLENALLELVDEALQEIL